MNIHDASYKALKAFERAPGSVRRREESQPLNAAERDSWTRQVRNDLATAQTMCGDEQHRVERGPSSERFENGPYLRYSSYDFAEHRDLDPSAEKLLRAGKGRGHDLGFAGVFSIGRHGLRQLWLPQASGCLLRHRDFRIYRGNEDRRRWLYQEGHRLQDRQAAAGRELGSGVEHPLRSLRAISRWPPRASGTSTVGSQTKGRWVTHRLADSRQKRPRGRVA